MTHATESIVDLINRAQALAESGQARAAIQAYQAWLESNDGSDAYAALFNMAVLHFQTGRIGLAQAALRACLSKHPGFAPASAVCSQPLLDFHRPMAVRASFGHTKLRVVWLSDAITLRAHQLATLLNFLLNCDGTLCEHILFGWGETVPAGIQNLSDRNDDEAACLIRSMEADVLIDLMGWSANARPGIIAYHPASLQLTWTPIPQPSGLKSIDGVIADRAVLPEGDIHLFREPVHWLEPALPMTEEGLQSFATRVETLLQNAHGRLPPRLIWAPVPTVDLMYLEAPKVRQRRYAIFAPPYEHTSAGIRVLYDLQKWLTLAGEDAIVVTWFSGYPSAQFADDIVIYPEVAPGNVANAKRVVRYILNTPGKLGHGERTYSDNELLVAYNKDLAPYADGLVLQVPSIEPAFHSVDCNKTIDAAVYVGKGRDLGLHPPDSVTITKSWPPTRADVAELLRSTKTLYTYDNFTMLAAEAQVCGCDVKVIQSDGSIVDCTSVALPNVNEFRQQLHQFIQLTRQL